MTTEITAAATPKKLVAKFADRYSVDADKLLHTLKQTCFRLSKADAQVSNEQMMALLIVADQHGLNPFTREIFAFEDRQKGVVPVVSVDGWARIINSRRDLDGIEFRFSEKMITMPGGKPAPEWCEVMIYHKGRSRPTVVREYLDEVYVPPRNGYAGPWATHTKRFLRHKTLIQGARVAFGFGGIYDEDEAHRVVEGVATRVTDTGNVSNLQAALEAKAAPKVEQPEQNTIDAEFKPVAEEASDAATTPASEE